MQREVPIVLQSRSESDQQEFREAHRLLLAFGISAVPATLLLGVMRIDFLEGDFGPAGTTAMTLAGSVSLVCAVASLISRRVWASGGTLNRALALICWPLVLTLVCLCAALLAFAMDFTFLRGRS